MTVKKLLSPKTCYRWCCLLQPWIFCLWVSACVYGLGAGLAFAPPDYQQGDAFRIIYIHVPAAVMSLLVYVVMTIAVIIHFIWKIKIADTVAKVSAPLGALFTVLTLIAGALWGKPTWGTFWIWDARLTSELILLFIYCGIIAMRSAIPAPRSAAQASGIITLIGMANLPIIHFSVVWWHTLHQGATLFKFSKPTIAPTMLWPLIAMLAAFLFYYIWMLLIKIRYELLIHEQHTAWVKSIVAGE